MCKASRHQWKLKTADAYQVILFLFIVGICVISEMIRPHILSFMEVIRGKEKHLRLEKIRPPEKFDNQPLASVKIHKLDNTLIMTHQEKKTMEHKTQRRLYY